VDGNAALEMLSVRGGRGERASYQEEVQGPSCVFSWYGTGEEVRRRVESRADESCGEGSKRGVGCVAQRETLRELGCMGGG
jgi:hypothetical protein